VCGQNAETVYLLHIGKLIKFRYVKNLNTTPFYFFHKVTTNRLVNLAKSLG